MAKKKIVKTIFKAISQMSKSAKSLMCLVDCQALKATHVIQAEMRQEPKVNFKLLEPS